MNNYPITISLDKQIHRFEIGEYLHHDGENCKIKVFQNGKMVASFEPDNLQHLHICQNPGSLNGEMLHILAEQIEASHPRGFIKNSVD